MRPETEVTITGGSSHVDQSYSADHTEPYTHRLSTDAQVASVKKQTCQSKEALQERTRLARTQGEGEGTEGTSSPRKGCGPQPGTQGHTSEQDAVVSLLGWHPDGCGKPVYPALPGAIEGVLGGKESNSSWVSLVGWAGGALPPWGRGSLAGGRGSPGALATEVATA